METWPSSQRGGKDGFAGTDPVYADQTFDDRLELTVGGVRLQLIYPGAAHTPGDSIVWLPEKRIAFSGDIVYVERLLNLSEISRLGEWIASFEALARLDPVLVVPQRRGKGAAVGTIQIYPFPLDGGRLGWGWR